MSERVEKDVRYQEAVTQAAEITGDRITAATIVNRLGWLWARDGNPYEAGSGSVDRGKGT